jgi:hypothetical protein
MKTIVLASRIILITSLVTSMFLASMLLISPQIVSAGPAEENANTPAWIRSYNGGGDDFAMDVVIDASDNVFVGGVYWNSTANGWYYNIVKYDTNGQYLWERGWSSGWNSGNPLLENYAGYSISLATDSLDDIVAETNQRVQDNNGTVSKRFIVKYSSQGERLWDKLYDNAGGQNIEGNSVVIDSDDNIISTGTSYNGAGSFADTIKFSPDGAELWHNQSYAMPNGGGVGAVTVDSRKNIIVCGQDQGKMWMIKYDSGGNELWRASDPSIYPAAVVADSQDNMIFTGIGQPGVTLDYYTTKYGTDGHLQWAANFDSGFFDWGAFDIAIDSQDNATVAGLSYFISNPEGTSTRESLIDFMKTADYCAITYDPQGNMLCKRTYNGQYGDQGVGVATDSRGNVVLTGTSYDGATFNYVTVKFPRYIPAPPMTATPLSNDSTTAEALQTPDQKTIQQTGPSSIFALILTAIFLLMSAFFNSSIKSNYSLIQAWLKSLLNKVKLGNYILNNQGDNEKSHLKDYTELFLLLILNACINTFIKRPSTISAIWATFIPSLIMAIVVTLGYAGAQTLMSNRRYNVPAAVRMYYVAILVTIMFVVFSWVLKYPPILIYGFIGGYFARSLGKRMNSSQRAKSILISVAVVLVISVLSFYLRGMVPRESATFWAVVLDNTLAKICCGGLLGLLLFLLPFEFMDGAKLKEWNFWIWLSIFYLVAFAFTYYIIIEDNNIVNALRSEQSIGVYIFMGICILLGMGSWLFFILRSRRVKVMAT